MANKFLDDNGLLYFWQKIVDKIKGNVVNNLTTTDATKSLSAAQGKALDDKITAINTNLGNLGGGDMMKSQYDTNNNGKVDTAENAEKLGGNSPDYYLAASTVGQASGIASLGADGKVPTSQLPETAPIEHTHEIDDVTGLREMGNTITEIANGKCACYVFDTVKLLDDALAEYVAYITEETEMSETNILNGQTLKTGDVFLIRAIDVPDYWWDGTKNEKQVLETTKVDITVIENSEIDTIVAQ